MTIVQHPSGLELSGNLTKFLVSATAQFAFTLKKGTETILEQTYDPGSSGQVEIDIRDIVEANLSYNLQDASSIYEQTTILATFSAIIGTYTIPFAAIRSGVDRFSDTAANFLAANFLTWQPQRKKVTFYSPEFLTYYAQAACTVHLEAHYPDDTTETIVIGSLEAGKAYTIPCQYALVNSLLTKKLPGYYDVFVSSIAGNRYTYVQRFVVSNRLSEDEQWILFENTLGGCDTFRAYGQNELTAEHTHNIAEIDEVSEEYRVDTERKYNKNTGYLDNYERRWLLDFFPSKKKYIYEDSAVRQIVVTESDATFISKTLPSAYTFTYKYAASKPLLNLNRSEELPTEVVVYSPDTDSFSLPPRLVDFPRLTLSGGALILMQSPFSETWGITTLGELLEFIGADTDANHQADPTHLIGEIDDTDPADDNAYSALRAEKEFLHKNREDSAAALIKFLKGANFGDFAAGIETGKGGRIDESGNGEFNSLILRSFLKVPQLIYNKETVTGGEMWNTEGGVVKAVYPDGDNSFVCVLEVEDGDIISLQVDDICKGRYNSNGGFITSYFRVTHVDQASKLIRIVLGALSEVPGGINFAVVPFMNVARYGNFTDTTRQRSQYFSSSEQTITLLTGVDSYIISSVNRALVIGALTDLDLPENLPIDKSLCSGYMRNLIVENLYQLDGEGVPVKTIRDRGLWTITPDSIYLCNSLFQDEVYHQSCKYRCIVEGTTQEPAYNSTDWLLVAGDTSLALIISSSNGKSFLYNQLSTTLTAVVMRGLVDITAGILDSDWSWARETGDIVSDAVWNTAHADSTSSVSLTATDLNNITGKFTCTVYVRDGDTGETLTQEILF